MTKNTDEFKVQLYHLALTLEDGQVINVSFEAFTLVHAILRARCRPGVVTACATSEPTDILA